MIKDIHSGSSDSLPTQLTAVGNILYFRANNGISGYELWKTDGTESNTMMIKDIYSGYSGSSPTELTAIGNTLYFRADNGTSGYELWKTDGTESNTIIVKDINNGYGSSTPIHLTAVGNTIYFQADDGINGREFWKSDGTESGTVIVKDINTGNGNGEPYEFTSIGSTIYFRANNGINGYELWKSDGTESGTVMVKDIYDENIGSYPYQLTPVGNTLYFVANNGTTGYELWKSGGTESTTMMVKDIYNGGDSSSPAYLTAAGNTLYFRANDGLNGVELWSSDGTESGTMMVKDIDEGTYGSNPVYLTPLGSTILFVADGALYSYSKTMTSVYQGYLECLIIADPGEVFGIEFSSSDSNSVANSYPLEWEIDVNLQQIFPLEDPLRGDSEGPSSLPTLLQHNDSVSGMYNFYYDQDDYSIAINHGTMQHIVVTTEAQTEMQFYNSECGREGEEKFSVAGESQNFRLDESITTHSFWCDTRFIADELKFSLRYDGGVGSTAAIPAEPNTYSIEVFTTQMNSTIQSSYDPPARGVLPILSTQQSIEGSFRHWSDQTDSYELITTSEQNVIINLSSNCATLHANKYGFHESISTLTHTSTLNKETLSNGSNLFTVEVKRIDINNIHDVEIKDTCIYTIKTIIDSSPRTSHYEKYGLYYILGDHDYRFSPSTTVEIDNLSSYLPESVTSDSYEIWLPFDVLPTLDGYIEVTQSSGQIPTVELSGTHTLISSGTNHPVGQHIEVNDQRVQWNEMIVSNLDGSELRISFTETPLNTFTREGNELFSRASGALGMSRDEGWDSSDTWYFNTTSNTASHASVRISSLADGLRATLSNDENGAISQLVCFNGNSDSITVYHQNGSGTYDLEVVYGYGGCPNLDFNAPEELPALSSFEVSSYSSDVERYFWKIFDHSLTQIYQGTDSDERQIISLPSSMIDGSYRLLMTDQDGLIYLDRPLKVTSQPVNVIEPTNAYLDAMESPKLEIRSIMPYSGEPVSWTFSNISILSVSNTGEVTIQNLENEYSGFGSKVIEIGGFSDTMAGSRIILQGDLNTEVKSTSHIVHWERTFYSPQIECDEQISPSFTNPENDILCLVSLIKKTHNSGNEFLGIAEHQVNGLLDVYDGNLTRISQIDFTNDLFDSTPIRINAFELGNGEYYTKLNFSNTDGIYISEEVSRFRVGNYQYAGQENNSSQFEFNLISVRDTAAAGDDVVLAWSTTGGVSEYFLVEVYAGEQLVDSYYILNDNSTEGEFNVELPSNVNSYLNHRIEITAFDNLLSSHRDVVNLGGISQQVYLEVNVNPDRPTVGSNVEVNLMISSDDDWLSWSWSLQSSRSTSSDILATGTGFAASNEGSFEFELPLSQYTSTPYLHITAESEDGSTYNEIIPIEPVPLRSVSIEADTKMVIGSEYEVEWEVTGEYLNSVDDVQRVEFAIYTMDYERYHEETYFVDSDSGEFSVLAPNSLNPGSHRIGIVFTFSDGETYEHSQIITVQSTPDGISVLGFTIPPIAMGFDTLIVFALVIHAIFYHIRGSRSKSNEDFKKNNSNKNHPDYQSIVGESEFDYVHQKEELLDEPQEMIEESEESELEIDEYPMYQEYPLGSGNQWVRYREDLDWELVEL